MQLKDYIEIILVSIAVITFIISVYDRRKKLVLDQLKLAKEYIDEIDAYEKTKNALKLIDEVTVKVECDGETIEINFQDVLDAMNIKKNDNYKGGKKDELIYDWFTDLFFYFDRIQMLVDKKIIKYEHIYSPYHYYIKRMGKNKNIFLKYLDRIEVHPNAKKFINTF